MALDDQEKRRVQAQSKLQKATDIVSTSLGSFNSQLNKTKSLFLEMSEWIAENTKASKENTETARKTGEASKAEEKIIKRQIAERNREIKAFKAFVKSLKEAEKKENGKGFHQKLGLKNPVFSTAGQKEIGQLLFFAKEVPIIGALIQEVTRLVKSLPQDIAANISSSLDVRFESFRENVLDESALGRRRIEGRRSAIDQIASDLGPAAAFLPENSIKQLYNQRLPLVELEALGQSRVKRTLLEEASPEIQSIASESLLDDLFGFFGYQSAMSIDAQRVMQNFNQGVQKFGNAMEGT